MKVIIYGFGKYGRSVYQFLKSNQLCEIVGVFDKKHIEISDMCPVEVLDPSEIFLTYFDLCLICNHDEAICDEMRGFLVESGVVNDKIFVLNYSSYNLDSTDDSRERVSFLLKYQNTLQNVNGSVAECGVCRGRFAKYINAFFPERKCYLFDIFESFDSEAYNTSAAHSERTDGMLKGWSNVFSDFSFFFYIRKQMLFPENVVIKKGYVPDSFVDINDMFCYVNLDMDFRIPQFEALKFFWPRMEKGGIITLHDYGDEGLTTTEAVRDFEEWLGYIPREEIVAPWTLAVFKE